MNSRQVESDIDFSALDRQTSDLSDFVQCFEDGARLVNRDKPSILEKFLVEHVVRMKKDLFTTDQDDLSVLSQVWVFQLSDESNCGLFIALERSNHFMVHHRVDCTH